MKADRFAKPQLSCISPLDKKAWNSGEAYFGPLKGGFVRDNSVSFARLMMAEGGQGFLEKLGERFIYDINIGYNGKIWVSTDKP